MQKRKVTIYKPNILSIMWLLMCLKIICLDTGNRGIIDYLVWGISCCLMIVYCQKCFKTTFYMIGYPFLALVCLQVVDLFQLCTRFSITCIIATVCIFSFITVNVTLNKEIQYTYIIISFLFVFLIMLYKVYHGFYAGNTLPGCMVFLAYGFLVAELEKNIENNKNSIWNWIKYIMVLGGIIYICWKSGARTALFTIPIIFISFYFMPKNIKIVRLIFVALIVGCTLVTIIYLNIHSFGWYNTINNWSMLKFGKQLDSSRPELWRVSLESLKWWQIIIGAGTGKLPSILRYQTASFHNSYIQLLMQNGLLGLSCLILVFSHIWKRLSRYCEDSVVRLVLSIFVGIIIYNCFECTLLQNKAFLGLIEWSILCLGLIRVKKLENKLE